MVAGVDIDLARSGLSRLTIVGPVAGGEPVVLTDVCLPGPSSVDVGGRVVVIPRGEHRTVSGVSGDYRRVWG
jgi:hypothetical protein